MCGSSSSWRCIRGFQRRGSRQKRGERGRRTQPAALNQLMGGSKYPAEDVVQMIPDATMGFSVVRSPGPGIGVSGWEGAAFVRLEACCLFFGFFWFCCVWALNSGRSLELGSRMRCWAWLGCFVWVSSRIINFFVWDNRNGQTHVRFRTF